MAAVVLVCYLSIYFIKFWVEWLIKDKMLDRGMSTDIQEQEIGGDYDYHRRRQIYIRIIEQLSGEEAIELINTLNRVNRFKWLLDLRVRINFDRY